MGGLSCTNIKEDFADLTIIKTYSENHQNKKKQSIIKLQSKFRSYFLIKSLKKSLSISHTFFSNRPDLKEVSETDFKETLTEQAKQVLKNLGDLQRDKSNITTNRLLINRGPVLFEDNTVYIGCWNLLREREGYGIIYRNGGISEGEFKNDRMNGKGRIINPEGDYYEGYFLNDKANGYGIYFSIEGILYKGEWKDDQQNGKGVEIHSDLSKYEGDYFEGSKHGKGKFEWKDGSIYEGDFKNNVIDGIGKCRWKDGREYNGEWKNNKMEGKGVFVWTDMRRFEGSYKADKKWGYGIFIWPNGKKYEGGWFNGKQHGHGIMTINGIKKHGEWKMGKKLRWIEENIDQPEMILSQIKSNLGFK